MKVKDVPDVDLVMVSPTLLVRTRLYVEILFLMEGLGATQTMVMVVVPLEVICTNLGGSGLGGAKSIRKGRVDSYIVNILIDIINNSGSILHS